MVAADTPTNEDEGKWSVADYPFLEEGASVGEPIWVMPECPEDHAPDPGQLCLGFSAGLLHEYYWYGDIQYEFEYEDESDGINAPDRGDVFVFYGQDDVPQGEDQLAWKTTDLDTNELHVTPGDYTHRYWAFTEPGTYRLQVHAKGHPKPALKSQMTRPDRDYLRTITSEVREYTIHVGLMGDLHLELDFDTTRTPPPITSIEANPGENVPFVIAARNFGPDTATNVKVGVELPDGLTYYSYDTSTGTYNSGTGIWDIGDMMADESAEVTLTITATVADNTRGTQQKIKATIYATEHIGTSDVVELDPLTDDNMAMGTVIVISIPNEPPMALFKCSVDEESDAGTEVCTVMVKDRDGDSLTYALKGDGKDNFTVEPVADGALIKVARSCYLNHEDPKANWFDLTLQVRDNKDVHSNDDPTEEFDTSIAVEITVNDVDEGTPVTLTAPSAATLGTSIRLSASLINAPLQEFDYIWVGRPPGRGD